MKQIIVMWCTRMRVKRTEVKHISEVLIGKFAFHINVDIEGVEIDNKELAEQAMHFNNVVLTGREPLEQREEVANFINKLRTRNKDNTIIIETHGTIIPIGVSNADGLMFIVNPLLKCTGGNFEDRIKQKAFNWFVDLRCNFKFMVGDGDDFDEVGMLINTFGIKKSSIYLMAYDLVGMKYVASRAKMLGVNFSPKLDEVLEE